MADKKISELPSLKNVTGNEEIPTAYQGQNNKVTITQIRAGLLNEKDADNKYLFTEEEYTEKEITDAIQSAINKLKVVKD